MELGLNGKTVLMTGASEEIGMVMRIGKNKHAFQASRRRQISPQYRRASRITRLTDQALAQGAGGEF